MKLVKIIASYVIVFCLGLLLLNLMTADYRELLRQTQRLENDFYIAFIRLSVIAVLFGVLIEWMRLLGAIKGKFGLNWLLVPALVLLALGLIHPYPYHQTFFGLPHGIDPLGWLVDPLKYGVTSILISVLAGILLVRSITKEND
ncbi:MAG: hypothetical protein H0Z39_11255 [Peptococcaceae bacterium]|nr:hypothetical protein [Peptococcaceae bacterium]